MHRKFLINIHIPKCGGTTFLEVLNRNFGEKFDFSYGHIWRDFFNSEQISNYIKTDHRFDAFSTHEISLNLPFDSDEFSLYSTIALRDPVDRCCSHYFFERQRGTSKFPDTLGQSLDAFIENLLDLEDHWLLNYQTKHLIRDTELQGIADVLDFVNQRKVFPIVVERFTDSMMLLEDRLPFWFADCSYVQANQSEHTESLRPDLKKRLADRNHQDVMLHHWANGILDQFIAERGDDIGNVSTDFIKRCARHSRRSKLKETLRQITNPIRHIIR